MTTNYPRHLMMTRPQRILVSLQFTVKKKQSRSFSRSVLLHTKIMQMHFLLQKVCISHSLGTCKT